MNNHASTNVSFTWIFRDLRLSLLEHGRWSLIEKYEALSNGLSTEALLDFVNAFKSRLWVEGLVQGNFTGIVSMEFGFCFLWRQMYCFICPC